MLDTEQIEKKHEEHLKHHARNFEYEVTKFCDVAKNTGIAFRGHDEKNRGNIIELIKHTTSYDEEVANVVLENAPSNTKYTSPEVEKEILHVFAEKVQKKIVEDICDSKYCIIVDEASDESKKEQMAIVLRYVDKKDTSSSTLYSSICATLTSYKLAIENLREQGYDGASNMRGEWKGLQALFLKDYPCAYYIHCASCKRQDELQAAQAAKIAELLESGEIESGKGANQIGTLKCAGETYWSSHYNSISSLLRMYNPTCTVLENIKKQALIIKQKILGITDILCQALQQKSQNIISAITMVSHTKKLIETLRDNEWGSFLNDIIELCKQHDIEIPEFKDPYFEGRSNRKGGHITIEHHCHFDIFNETIDFQLQEIDTKFNERVKIDVLKFQLKHFEADVKDHPFLGNLSSIVEVCQGLVETGKSSHYYLIDRLIRLVLTLPVSTATTERAFSAMKIVKNRLRNKMDDDFITDNLILYIEKDVPKIFSIDSILDDFNDVRECRVQLK
ncbi:uncharacterized protein LOC128132931 [Lactuca sativa]|uniref:uncharacterized protein LOC128132931 n=1 Tax=Lactuca sativa TaxID=4236 RepID=UPI0022AFCB00|nr:uncharacterized protein LOC128132931 [Lactuca sativa]